MHATHFATHLCRSPCSSQWQVVNNSTCINHPTCYLVSMKRSRKPNRYSNMTICQAGFGSSGGSSSPSKKKSSNKKSSDNKPTPATPKDTINVKLPNSREEAITQAAGAIAYQLSGKGSGNKGRSKLALGLEIGQTISIEIPVIDSSSKAAVSLAQEVIACLPSDLAKQFTIITCGSTSNSTNNSIVALEELVSQGKAPSGNIIIAGPQKNQLPLLEKLMSNYKGAAAVVLNPEWAADLANDEVKGVDANFVAFAASFSTVYCFYPVAIKAFVVTAQEGVVFRDVGAESPSAPWRIFIQQGNDFQPVARMQRRPSTVEIEVSFINASAASSPLTQGAKFLKGLVDKKK